MKRIKFYVCQNCSNVITSTAPAEISCCGRILDELKANPEDEDHKLAVSEIDNEYYLALNHEMSKIHYISFVAHVSYDRVHLVKLYPEQNAELRIPRTYRGKIYYYCSKHGLIVKDK